MEEYKIKTLLHEEGYTNSCEVITNDIATCFKSYSGFNLFVKEIAFPPAFSEKERLLCVTGPLPVTDADGSLKAIPISVYLPKSYPTAAPLCYVGLLTPHLKVTVTESTHVDCYGRIHDITYLDPSLWKINYNLSVLMRVLIDSLSRYSSMYANTHPAPLLDLLLKNITTSNNSQQKKKDHHRSKSLSASATQLLRSLPQKSRSLKDVKLPPLFCKSSKQQEPHKDGPAPTQSVPHLNSSGELPCCSDNNDSPADNQSSPPSTSSLPIPFDYIPLTSMSSYSYQNTNDHNEEEPQQSILEDDHGSDIPVMSHITEVSEIAPEQSTSELIENIQNLEESTAQLQEEMGHEKAVKKNVKDSMEKMQEELATEKKQSAELKEKIKELEENMARMQTELAAEKETSSHFQNTVIPDLQERIADLENSLQCLEWVWVIPRDEVYLSNKVLGGGGWGCVHEATYRGHKVAAKRLHQAIVSQHNRAKFEKEMRMSAICRHRNLVEFIGAVRDDPAIIVVELMDKTLRQALTDKDIHQDNNRSVYMDVAEGLRYLHNLQPYPVIHRDISAPNVLLKALNPEQGDDINWTAKLSDFGSAQFAHLAQTPGPGCILYSAPEVRNDEPAQQTVKIDIYSYGVLLAEILTTDIPFDSLRNSLQKVDMQKPQFSDLVHQCTARHPEQRPFIDDVITQLHAINEVC